MELFLEPPTWTRNVGDDGENEIDDEDDEDQPLPSLPSPLFSWNPLGQSRLNKSDGKYYTKLLIVAIGHKPSAFLRSLSQSTSSSLSLIGSLLLPEVPLVNCAINPEIGNPNCLIYSWNADSKFPATFFLPSTSNAPSQRSPTEGRPREVKTETITLKKMSLKEELRVLNYLHAVEQKANFYASSNAEAGITVVFSQQPVGVDRAFDWTETLFRHIQPRRVMILDTIQDSSFQLLTADGEMTKVEPPLLRMMQTSHLKEALENRFNGPEKSESDEKDGKEKKKKSKKKNAFLSSLPCPFLESSNMVHQLNAAILSYCEMFGVAAELFLSLESLHYDHESVLAFEPLVPYLPLSPSSIETFTNQKPKAREQSYKRWSKLTKLLPLSLTQIPPNIFL